MFVWGKYESVCFLEWVWSTAFTYIQENWKYVIICVQNQWGVVHPWHGTVANLWGRHKDFTEFNENFGKSYLLNGLSNIVKFFTVWFLKIFCIKLIHIFFSVQCSFKESAQVNLLYSILARKTSNLGILSMHSCKTGSGERFPFNKWAVCILVNLFSNSMLGATIDTKALCLVQLWCLL